MSHPMPHSFRLYCAALFLFLCGAGYLVYAGISLGNVNRFGVAEALTMPPEKLQAVRIFGIVSPEQFIPAENALALTFLLSDQHASQTVIKVSYAGAIPENLKPGTPVYAEGDCSGSPAALTAHTLSTSCPSKYTRRDG